MRPQDVGQPVDRDDQDDQRHAGKEPDPPVTAKELIVAELDQHAERRARDRHTQAKIAEAQAGAQAKATAAGGTQERNVETPGNVLQRATASLGSQAPVTPGTPNQ